MKISEVFRRIFSKKEEYERADYKGKIQAPSPKGEDRRKEETTPKKDMRKKYEYRGRIETDDNTSQTVPKESSKNKRIPINIER